MDRIKVEYKDKDYIYDFENEELRCITFPFNTIKAKNCSDKTLKDIRGAVKKAMVRENKIVNNIANLIINGKTNLYTQDRHKH